MLEYRDPAIKLFGQKIPLLGEVEVLTAAGDDLATPLEVDTEREEDEEERDGDGDDDDDEQRNTDEQREREDKDFAAEKVTESLKEKKVDDPPPNKEETKNSDTLPDASVNPQTPSIDEETAKSRSGLSEKDQNDAVANSQERTLKKPDKILPCPRCNSMDTKFCYFNNYNINQPRYFCKACQRYWTAGGTMRNVPVGAGRRKNKNSSSHYRHLTISEALQAARIDAPNGTHIPAIKTNGRVLSFGLDAPICDSMASVLNLPDTKVLNGTRNGFDGLEKQRIPVPCRSGENGNTDDCSRTSSITASNPMEENGKTTSQEAVFQNNNGYPPQFPCLPWPYAWNTPVPSPALCPPGYPLSFYPATYWSCGVPNNWNIPWFPSHSSPPNPPRSPGSGPNSPTLGKHSRDGDMLKPDYMNKEEPPKQRNGCVLVPKTLRIDDPSEAAKSSIWATLGIKNETGSGAGLFKGYQAKKDEKNHYNAVEASPVLRANPAALSRSLNFHENT